MSRETSATAPSETSEPVSNPGWAGETGDFPQLTEAEIRGEEYARRPKPEGSAAGGVGAVPYQLAKKEPEAPLFEGAHAERLSKLISRYPNKQGALLPVLNLAHEIRGYLSPETMQEVARVLGLSPAYVRGVATFYTMYNKQPVGEYLIQVCTNVACNLCGADEVLEAFHGEAGAAEDRERFTIMEVECLGACGFPTAVQINDRYFENVEPADVPQILDVLRRGERRGE